MLLINDDWFIKVKEELYKIGLGSIWEGNEIDNNSFLIIKNRICDIFRQNNYEKITSSPKGHLYQYLKQIHLLYNTSSERL